MRHVNTHKNQLRVIAGSCKGSKIELPENSLIRPTKAIMKETLFNWLGNIIIGSNCLDLFAGSGALSLEALSRGANSSYIVDKEATNVDAIMRTAKRLGLSLKSEVGFAEKVAGRLEWEKYNLIFVDPPFEYEIEQIVNILSHKLANQAIVYIERDKKNFIDEIDCILKESKINKFELFKVRSFSGVTCGLLRNTL